MRPFIIREADGKAYAPDGRRAYPFVCRCGHTGYACLSMAMEYGLNTGCGSCFKCHTFLHLEMARDGESMKAVPHKHYLWKLRGSRDSPLFDPKFVSPRTRARRTLHRARKRKLFVRASC